MLCASAACDADVVCSRTDQQEQQQLEEQERQRAEAEARRAAEAAEQKRLEDERAREREVDKIRATLPDEPAPGAPDVRSPLRLLSLFFSSHSLVELQIVTVQFRLPDGSKLQRRFDRADRLQTVFDFVTLQGHPVSSGAVQLQLNFPRRILSEMDSSLTLRQVGLASQETVYVQTA